MGMSPEGIVFFGYSFNEGELEEFPDIDDITIARAKAKGAVQPAWGSIPRGFGPERDAWYAEHQHEIDAWFAAKKAEKDAMGDVEWHIAGSYDYGSPYVCIGASRLAAEWGEMINLNPDSMASVHPSWEYTLREHLLDIGIPLPEGSPRWYLTSLYG